MMPAQHPTENTHPNLVTPSHPSKNVPLAPVLPVPTPTPPPTAPPTTTVVDHLRYVPDQVMIHACCTFLTYTEYLSASHTCTYFRAHFNDSMDHHMVPVRVPEDFNTLNQAVKRAEQDRRITTVILGKGEHSIDKTTGARLLFVYSPLNIIGSPECRPRDIIVSGGIRMYKHCHLQNMHIRGSLVSTWLGREKGGVVGYDTFTMKDVTVEYCGIHGIFAHGAHAAGTCTNVVVRCCAHSGVFARSGGSVTLLGKHTSINNNCRGASRYEYGLKVEGETSSIRLVSPLTKETATKFNRGGGNWGAERRGDVDQIKTIESSALLAKKTLPTRSAQSKDSSSKKQRRTTEK